MKFHTLISAIALLVVMTLGAGIMPNHPRSAEALDPVADIASAGPLTHVYVDMWLGCQVAHAGDDAFAFFDPGSIPGDCGTFAVVDDILFAPNFKAGSNAIGSIGAFTPFTPVNQSAVTGSGTAADPYRVVTVVDAGSTGIRLAQTDSYVVGEESFRTEIRLFNTEGTTKAVRLYRAADCYAAGSDLGYGYADQATGGVVACTAYPNNIPSGRAQQFAPITPADHFYEDYFDLVWARIGTHASLPNTCACNTLWDNGIAIGWDRIVSSGAPVTVSLDTTVALQLQPPEPPPAPAPAPPPPPPPPPPPTEEDEQPSDTVVSPLATLTITTVIRDATGAPVSAVPVGTAVHDSVTVSGNVGTPSGTVTLSWFTNGTCSGVATASSGALSLSGAPGSGASTLDATAFVQTPAAAGNYGFRASYNGDGNYLPKTGDCEPLTVTPAPPPCDDRDHGDKDHDDRGHGDRDHGDRGHGDRDNNDRDHGDRDRDDRDHHDRDHGDRDRGDHDYGDRDHGDRDHDRGDRGNDDRDHGDRNNNDRDHGDRDNNDRGHGDRDNNDRGHDDRGHDDRGHGPR